MARGRQVTRKVRGKRRWMFMSQIPWDGVAQPAGTYSLTLWRQEPEAGVSRAAPTPEAPGNILWSSTSSWGSLAFLSCGPITWSLPLWSPALLCVCIIFSVSSEDT